jgi:hypothetical protein
MYVIEENGSIVIGPSGWNGRLAKRCGLEGNRHPPKQLPYDIDETKKLREVIFSKPALDKWQSHVEGAGTIDLFGRWNIPYTAADPSGSEIAAIREQIKKDVDEMADKQRALYVSPLWGQEQIYLFKEEEAKAYQSWLDSASVSDPPATPYLSAEAAATNQQISDLVAVVLANSALWNALSVHIEAHRMALKRKAATLALAELRNLNTNIGWTPPEE